VKGCGEVVSGGEAKGCGEVVSGREAKGCGEVVGKGERKKEKKEKKAFVYPKSSHNLATTFHLSPTTISQLFLFLRVKALMRMPRLPLLSLCPSLPLPPPLPSSPPAPTTSSHLFKTSSEEGLLTPTVAADIFPNPALANLFLFHPFPWGNNSCHLDCYLEMIYRSLIIGDPGSIAPSQPPLKASDIYETFGAPPLQNPIDCLLRFLNHHHYHGPVSWELKEVFREKMDHTFSDGTASNGRFSRPNHWINLFAQRDERGLLSIKSMVATHTSCHHEQAVTWRTEPVQEIDRVSPLHHPRSSHPNLQEIFSGFEEPFGIRRSFCGEIVGWIARPDGQQSSIPCGAQGEQFFQVQSMPFILFVEFGFQSKLPLSSSVFFMGIHYHLVGWISHLPGHFVTIVRNGSEYLKVDGYPKPHCLNLGVLEEEPDCVGEKQYFAFVKKSSSM